MSISIGDLHLVPVITAMASSDSEINWRAGTRATELAGRARRRSRRPWASRSASHVTGSSRASASRSVGPVASATASSSPSHDRQPDRDAPVRLRGPEVLHAAAGRSPSTRKVGDVRLVDLGRALASRYSGSRSAACFHWGAPAHPQVGRALHRRIAHRERAISRKHARRVPRRRAVQRCGRRARVTQS